MDPSKFPPGLRISEDQASPNISTAGPLDKNGTAYFEEPELLGIQTQIQHPTGSGKGVANTPGMMGIGLVMTPLGPSVMVQMMHPDGSSMAAIMSPDEFTAFGECYVDTSQRLLTVTPNPEGQA